MAGALMVGVVLMMTGLMLLVLGFVTAYDMARKGWQR